MRQAEEAGAARTPIKDRKWAMGTHMMLRILQCKGEKAVQKRGAIARPPRWPTWLTEATEFRRHAYLQPPPTSVGVITIDRVEKGYAAVASADYEPDTKEMWLGWKKKEGLPRECARAIGRQIEESEGNHTKDTRIDKEGAKKRSEDRRRDSKETTEARERAEQRKVRFEREQRELERGPGRKTARVAWAGGAMQVGTGKQQKIKKLVERLQANGRAVTQQQLQAYREVKEREREAASRGANAHAEMEEEDEHRRRAMQGEARQRTDEREAQIALEEVDWIRPEVREKQRRQKAAAHAMAMARIAEAARVARGKESGGSSSRSPERVTPSSPVRGARRATNGEDECERAPGKRREMERTEEETEETERVAEGTETSQSGGIGMSVSQSSDASTSRGTPERKKKRPKGGKQKKLGGHQRQGGRSTTEGV